MVLIGASGHAKVIIDILEKSNTEVSFLIDADPSILNLQAYKVFHDSEYSLQPNDEVIIAIGNNAIRKRLATSMNAIFGWAIHPSVQLADDVEIGQGTVLMASSIINSSTEVGNHCIINTAASLDHDCSLEDFVHISPNATVCGNVQIGEGTHVGAGATVIPNLKIGKWVTIGAGAVVIKDVPDGATVVGNPGRVIKKIDV